VRSILSKISCVIALSQINTRFWRASQLRIGPLLHNYTHSGHC
jgi:hypothetical protein